MRACLNGFRHLSYLLGILDQKLLKQRTLIQLAKRWISLLAFCIIWVIHIWRVHYVNILLALVVVKLVKLRPLIEIYSLLECL